MARMPTPEESARRVLYIFVNHFSGRPGWVLRSINFEAANEKKRYLHYDDLGPGMDHAVKQGWIEALPDGDSFRLTEAGFAEAPEPSGPPVSGKPRADAGAGVADERDTPPSAQGTGVRTLMDDAIRAVPAVKYALGIGGIVWVIAAVAALNVDYRVAVFGSVIMIVLMVLLLVFAKLAGTASTMFVLPMTVLVWFSILLTTLSALLLATSIFFRWPVDLQYWLAPASVTKPAADVKMR